MTALAFVVTYFAAFFAFGFGIAFAVPLLLAMQEPPRTNAAFRMWGGLADLLLIILGGFPVFWLLFFGMKIGRKWPEAQAKWRADATVRRHFRIFLTSFCLMIGSIPAWK